SWATWRCRSTHDAGLATSTDEFRSLRRSAHVESAVTESPGGPETMPLDLFAGIYVRDYEAAKDWYERLLGSGPTFVASDTEAVCEPAVHRSLFIEAGPDHAGLAVHTVFVDDFDTRVDQIAQRGIEPAERVTYPNGVRKARYRDPDGNE